LASKMEEVFAACISGYVLVPGAASLRGDCSCVLEWKGESAF